jgi:hypothetical protein
MAAVLLPCCVARVLEFVQPFCAPCFAPIPLPYYIYIMYDRMSSATPDGGTLTARDRARTVAQGVPARGLAGQPGHAPAVPGPGAWAGYLAAPSALCPRPLVGASGFAPQWLSGIHDANGAEHGVQGGPFGLITEAKRSVRVNT